MIAKPEGMSWEEFEDMENRRAPDGIRHRVHGRNIMRSARSYLPPFWWVQWPEEYQDLVDLRREVGVVVEDFPDDGTDWWTVPRLLEGSKPVTDEEVESSRVVYEQPVIVAVSLP
jgi:hypothetical protein